jgi:hypothetical protein
MGKLCDCDEVPLEQYEIIRARADRLEDQLKSASKTIVDLLALHDPKEASSYAAQATITNARNMVASLVELERSGGNGHSNGTPRK